MLLYLCSYFLKLNQLKTVQRTFIICFTSRTWLIYVFFVLANYDIPSGQTFYAIWMDFQSSDPELHRQIIRVFFYSLQNHGRKASLESFHCPDYLILCAVKRSSLTVLILSQSDLSCSYQTTELDRLINMNFEKWGTDRWCFNSLYYLFLY